MEKLVRQHVPDQLRALGETIETRIARPEEMLKLLRDKLVEEVSELVEAIDSDTPDQIAEELSDVMEVVDTLEMILLPAMPNYSVASRKRQKYGRR